MHTHEHAHVDTRTRRHTHTNKFTWIKQVPDAVKKIPILVSDSILPQMSTNIATLDALFASILNVQA